MSALAFAAAAGVIGLLAASRKSEQAKLDPIDESPIEMHTGPDAIVVNAGTPPAMGTDAAGGVSQVAHDGLGAQLAPTTSSPAPSAAPSAALGGELAPASTTGTPSGSTLGGKPCASCEKNAIAGKQLYATLTRETAGLTATDQARLLSSTGAKSGAIW